MIIKPDNVKKILQNARRVQKNSRYINESTSNHLSKDNNPTELSVGTILGAPTSKIKIEVFKEEDTDLEKFLLRTPLANDMVLYPATIPEKGILENIGLKISKDAKTYVVKNQNNDVKAAFSIQESAGTKMIHYMDVTDDESYFQEAIIVLGMKPSGYSLTTGQVNIEECVLPLEYVLVNEETEAISINLGYVEEVFQFLGMGAILVGGISLGAALVTSIAANIAQVATDDSGADFLETIEGKYTQLLKAAKSKLVSEDKIIQIKKELEKTEQIISNIKQIGKKQLSEPLTGTFLKVIGAVSIAGILGYAVSKIPGVKKENVFTKEELDKLAPPKPGQFKKQPSQFNKPGGRPDNRPDNKPGGRPDNRSGQQKQFPWGHQK